jgi:Cu2+-containing amine oxidase
MRLYSLALEPADEAPAQQADFPVMPMERISVMLKPDGFFTKNPALDVPQSSQPARVR